LISGVNNIGVLLCRHSQYLVEKITYDVCFGTQFSQFSPKQKSMLFRLLSIILSPLGLVLSNSMFGLLAI
jgi:hypothetical protein